MDKHIVKEILNGIVEGGVKESNGNFNFRCPLCHDSKKSRMKRRGWVLLKEERELFYCFNCGASISFKRMLKENYPTLHARYVRNRDVKEEVLRLGRKDIKLVEQPTPKNDEVEIITDDFMANSFPLYDKTIGSTGQPSTFKVDKNKLMLQYNALKYIVNRKLPKEYLNQMRICYKGKFANRLLIPYYNFDGEVYCFQGRTLTEDNEKGVKYLTNKPEKNNKIFRYYLSNPDEDVYITEGPVDSMFFDNGIATSGLLRYGTKEFDQLDFKFKKRVWVFDRDKEGLKEAVNYADKGERVFCWPSDLKVKDINELYVKKDLTKEELLDIVKKNIFTRFDAVIKLKFLQGELK
jgi:hypothetical protein